MICYLPFRPRLLFKGRQFGYSPSKAQSKTRTETACRLHALPLLVKKARDVLDTGYPRYTWLWSNDFFGYRSSFTDKCRGWELLIIASGALGRWWHVWMLEKKNETLLLLKYKKFKKIAWIQSHHPHLQWKFKLLAGKFTWGNKAKHCRVFWQCPAMFCL